MHGHNPTSEESARRDAVLSRILYCIRSDVRIKLPDFDPQSSVHNPESSALLQIPENDFSGSVGHYRYQFEGEDDLLHLIVTRLDGHPLTPEEARQVAAFTLPNIPSAVIWLKPGEMSQHFYLGHDELLRD